MTFLEEVAQFLHDTVDYLGGFSDSVAFFGSLWESFVTLLTNWWGAFTGFFQNLFIS